MEITWLYASYPWDPEDPSNFGTEQAIVHLSQHWTTKGYRVTVYGNVPAKSVKGVCYARIESFDMGATYSIFIICRAGTLAVLGDQRPKSNLVLFDLQDAPNIYDHSVFVPYVDCFMFKSKYHSNLYSYLSLDKSQVFICPNGIQVENFKDRQIARDKLRFCYTSSYQRGLEQLLEWSWPEIHKQLPGSQLHVYYGWQPWFYCEKIDALLKQPGVVHHGRVSNSEIAEEKYRSSMHLYPCHAATEIDCINMRESALSGCIPVLSDQNVCPERDGVHVSGDPTEKSFHEQYVKTVIELYHDEPRQEELRKKFSCGSFLFGWEFVGDQWISVFTRSP